MNGGSDDGKPAAPIPGATTLLAAPAGGARPRRINSAELLAGGREILIDHLGETYRLRHTSQGKLILTK
jgi:hemin uptake protein HemP